MGMDSHLAINQGIYCLFNFFKVAVIHLVEFLDKSLRSGGGHATTVTLLLVLHLLLLLVAYHVLGLTR